MEIFLKCLWRLFFTWRLPEREHSATSAAVDHSSSKPNFEVERKYRVDENELAEVKECLAAMSYKPARLIAMTDQFLPVRIRGEMLRIRDEVVESHSETLLTIKEWVNIAGGRERRESEGKLSPMVRRFLLSLGRLLKGGALMCFSKLRQEHLNASEPGVVITLDDVSGLGKHSGHYAEIEVLVPQGGDVKAARAQIAQLALRLFNEERQPVEMSYQQMLEDSLQQTA